jgi:hypothetical protein
VSPLQAKFNTLQEVLPRLTNIQVLLVLHNMAPT